jgi:hypothetical protein
MGLRCLKWPTYNRCQFRAGYTTYLARVISPPGRESFTIYWCVLVTVLSPSTPLRWVAASVRFRHPMLPSPYGCGLGPRISSFLRPRPVTRNPPKGDLVDRLQDRGDFGHPSHPAIRTTGLLTFALAGLSPAEHNSLYWSQQPDVKPLDLSGSCHRTKAVASR